MHPPFQSYKKSLIEVEIASCLNETVVLASFDIYIIASNIFVWCFNICGNCFGNCSFNVFLNPWFYSKTWRTFVQQFIQHLNLFSKFGFRTFVTTAVVVYKTFCIDIAQCRMNETRTYSWRFASLACWPRPYEWDTLWDQNSLIMVW